MIILSIYVKTTEKITEGLEEQGHHHNGNRAARLQHTLGSICVHSFWALAKTVDCLLHQQMYPKMCSIDIFVNLQPVG